MFIAALFTIAKTWKQPKCLSTEEWIKKTWGVCVCVCVCVCVGILAIKRNEIMPFAATWMNHGDTVLSEITQSQKDKYCMFPLT